MNTGNTCFQLANSIVVMNGVQKAGDQIERLVNAEVTHVLQCELRFRAAKLSDVQHGLINIQPATLIAKVNEMPNMQPGATR
ncbi:hypothetical protein D3C77_742130 [compost metagenome]